MKIQRRFVILIGKKKVPRLCFGIFGYAQGYQITAYGCITACVWRVIQSWYIERHYIWGEWGYLVGHGRPGFRMCCWVPAESIYQSYGGFSSNSQRFCSFTWVKSEILRMGYFTCSKAVTLVSSCFRFLCPKSAARSYMILVMSIIVLGMTSWHIKAYYVGYIPAIYILGA